MNGFSLQRKSTYNARVHNNSKNIFTHNTLVNHVMIHIISHSVDFVHFVISKRTRTATDTVHKRSYAVPGPANSLHQYLDYAH